MPQRSTPPPQRGYSGFQPPNDSTTYRDLLMFEERLKSNTMNLSRRKSRYQLFLAQLLATIAFLFCEVVLQTSFMAIPYRFLLRKILSGFEEEDVQLHPYIALSMLFVAVTTLFLFFASGMYSEKIGYANKYVPHANRALRNFNMYFNVRRKSLRSKLNFNPFSFLFSRPAVETPSDPMSRPPSPIPNEKTDSGSLSVKKSTGSVPIPPIPPTKNPRGELIFSSRVDKSFREGYERYRSAFEWKRQERERIAFEQTWLGHRFWPWNWWRKPLPPPPPIVRGQSPGAQISRGRKLSSTSSSSGTPSDSRRSTPSPMSSRAVKRGGKGLGTSSR